MEFVNQFFSEVYQYAPIGLVILDEKIELVDANDCMLDSFGIERQPLAGKRFGNVFGCSLVAGTDYECGSTAGCSICDLRSGISSVLLKDTMIKDMTVSHAFFTGGVRTQKWFKLGSSAISTSDGKFVIVSFVDITTEKQYEQLLSKELTYDYATGAVSKKHLTDILTNMPQYMQLYQAVSVGIIDMDDFKDINDHYGHLKGDEVLQSFSEIAQQTIRKQDIVGRFGGEEFMLVLPGASIRAVALITKRIHDALSQRFEAQGVEGVSFSAGFIEVPADPQNSLSKEEMISAADGYLYQAKRSGKRMLVSKGFSMKF